MAPSSGHRPLLQLYTCVARYPSRPGRESKKSPWSKLDSQHDSLKSETGPIKGSSISSERQLNFDQLM